MNWVACYCLLREFFFNLVHSGVFLPYWSFFALGILLFQLFKSDITPERVFLSWCPVVTSVTIGLLALGVAAAAIGGMPTERLVFASVFTAMIWLGKPWNDKWQASLASVSGKPGILTSGLLLLGAMSYSLYLIHNALWTSSLALLELSQIRRGLLVDLLIIMATCLICYPFYKLCEAPVVGWCTRQRPEKTEPAHAVILPFPLPQALPQSVAGKRAA